MTLNVIVGTQWGDEGKGRIVDMLSADAAIVARFNGGDNAGHTVTVGAQTFKMHLIPSGIVHPNTIGLLGNGMVINPLALLDEIAALQQLGVEISPKRLMISPGAHLITPGHRMLDKAQDEARGKDAIGTTMRGIGPAYVDKVARRGLRTSDILDADSFAEKVTAHFNDVSKTLTLLYNRPALDVKNLAEEYVSKTLLLTPYIRDITLLLRDSMARGETILAEGAQGVLLDLDHGTYPFVTSSSTSAHGVFSGLGIGVQCVSNVLGVTKAFQTRVGSGPFPTELSGSLAERLRGTGANPWDEFGTTTGRPRRVGWLDGVLLRYATIINGITELCVTKLDILSGLNDINVCTCYYVKGKKYDFPPFGLEASKMAQYEPLYEVVPGWQEDISGVRSWDDLPKAAQNYILFIEKISGIPVSYISVGPERDQTIKR
jgi:adenylosuccinate synthase